MGVYAAILRGVNVGANRKVPMAQLKILCETLGLKGIATYIQSGNLVFEADTIDGLQQKLETAIEATFGFAVPALIRDRAELAAVVTDNPFLNERGVDLSKLHVTFLERKPEATLTAKLDIANFMPDRFIIDGQTVYLHIPESYGDTKLSNSFFESRLKVKATTRNWKTVVKLAEMTDA